MAITVLPDPNLPYEQMNRESIMNAMQIFLGMMEAKRKKRDTASEIEYRGKTGDAATVNAQANMTSATAGAQFNVAQADKAYQEMRTEEEQNAYLDWLTKDPNTSADVRQWAQLRKAGGTPQLPGEAYPSVQAEAGLNRQSQYGQEFLQQQHADYRARLAQAASMQGSRDYKQAELSRGWDLSQRGIKDEDIRHDRAIDQMILEVPGLRDFDNPKQAYYAWKENPAFVKNLRPDQAAAFSTLDNMLKVENARYDAKIKELQSIQDFYSAGHMQGAGYKGMGNDHVPSPSSSAPSGPSDTGYQAGGLSLGMLDTNTHRKAFDEIQALVTKLGQDKVRIGNDQYVYIKNAQGTEVKYGFSSDGSLYAAVRQ